jgi:nitrogen fixation NifU-like protein
VIDDLYREIVIDHARRPHHARRLEAPTVAHHGVNIFCGDRVEVGLRIEGDRLVEAGVRGEGCAICKASGSMLAELVAGATLGQAEERVRRFRGMLASGDGDDHAELGDATALSGVGRFPARVKCALLPWLTLQEAIELYRSAGGP